MTSRPDKLLSDPEHSQFPNCALLPPNLSLAGLIAPATFQSLAATSRFRCFLRQSSLEPACFVDRISIYAFWFFPNNRRRCRNEVAVLCVLRRTLNSICERHGIVLHFSTSVRNSFGGGLRWAMLSDFLPAGGHKTRHRGEVGSRFANNNASTASIRYR
jgi:hypothetical protein